MTDLIGIPVIDAQHAGLFDTFTRLQRSDSDETLSEILTKLGKQIQDHFHTEEILMRGMGLPADMLHGHVSAHNTIQEELAELHWHAMRGKAKTIDEVVTTVSAWVIHHLAEYDFGLKPYISGFTDSMHCSAAT